MFSAPNHVNFLLTHRCNLGCDYCYVPFDSYSNELSTEQIIGICDLLYESGVFSLDLTGGEPLLRDDIAEILKYCNDLDIDVGLATNGILLTKERGSELGKVWNKKRTVHVSVDASTPEKFFQITGSKDFFKVLDCTKALLEYELDVIWNFVYSPENKGDLIPVCELASDLGVSKMFILPLIRVGRAINLPFSFEELQNFLVLFPDIEKEYPSIQFRVTPATPLDLLIPLFEIGWDLQKVLRYYPYARTPLQDEKFSKIRTIGCIGGVGRWAINAQGDVYPCELLVTDDRMKCGNLLENSFDECLISSRSMLHVELDDIGDCASCEYGGICGGGCRARAFKMYGNLSAPDPLCPFHALRFKTVENKVEYSLGLPEKTQEYAYNAFTVNIAGVILRVRKESFGGTVYIPGREQQIYVNEDGYVIFEILQNTQDRNEIMSELEKREMSVDEMSVCNFLNQLYESL